MKLDKGIPSYKILGENLVRMSINQQNKQVIRRLISAGCHMRRMAYDASQIN